MFRDTIKIVSATEILRLVYALINDKNCQEAVFALWRKR